MTTWIENWVGDGRGRRSHDRADASADRVWTPARARTSRLTRRRSADADPSADPGDRTARAATAPNRQPPQQPYLCRSGHRLLPMTRRKSKINLDTPANSRLGKVRLRSEFHNCWSPPAAAPTRSTHRCSRRNYSLLPTASPTVVDPNLVTSKALRGSSTARRLGRQPLRGRPDRTLGIQDGQRIRPPMTPVVSIRRSI